MTGAGRPRGSSVRSPAPTGRACCRSSTRGTGRATPIPPRGAPPRVSRRGLAGMGRQGSKGASDAAAPVAYLFGYAAPAGVVADWRYEQLAASYVFAAETRQFMAQSNPWALRGIAERLLEAAQRGLWAEPDPKTLDGLRQVYLDLEGDLEDASSS